MNKNDKIMISTTLRMPSHLKQYYETLAKESYSSMQSVILQVLQKFMDENMHNREE